MSSLLLLYSHFLLQNIDRPCNGTTLILVLVLQFIRTHRLMACCILSFKSSLCTATSIRATASSPSALAVISMSLSHRPPCFCMSADQILMRARSSANKFMILTLQKNIRARASPAHGHGQPIRGRGAPGLPIRGRRAPGLPIRGRGAPGLPIRGRGASGLPMREGTPLGRKGVKGGGPPGLPMRRGGVPGLPVRRGGVPGLSIRGRGVPGQPPPIPIPAPGLPIRGRGAPGQTNLDLGDVGHLNHIIRTVQFGARGRGAPRPRRRGAPRPWGRGVPKPWGGGPGLWGRGAPGSWGSGTPGPRGRPPIAPGRPIRGPQPIRERGAPGQPIRGRTVRVGAPRRP